MRILLAPDKFKGALDAQQVCDEVAAAIRCLAPAAELDPCPLADGGEGAGTILARSYAAEGRSAAVLGPRGAPQVAPWWYEPRARIAIVELAQCAGLTLLTPSQRDPLQTTTFGVGQLLHEAKAAGAVEILLCVGGSATVDGGAGILQALGWGLYDDRDAPITRPITGADLERVTRITRPERALDCRLHVLCDVDNPLLGADGAAPAFAPQKGADADATARLERGLTHWAGLLQATLGVSGLAELRHGGAAGGVPAGLRAALGADLGYGFDRIAEAVGLRERVRRAELIISGEGRLDQQTRRGKVVAGVARLAADEQRPLIVLVGSAEQAESVVQAAWRLVAITPTDTPLERALIETRENLRACVTREFPEWTTVGSARR